MQVYSYIFFVHKGYKNQFIFIEFARYKVTWIFQNMAMY